MEPETLFVVLWRYPQASNPHWKASAVYSERRLAENFIECERARGETCQYAIVAGPITSPAQMSEAEKFLVHPALTQQGELGPFV